MFELHSYPLNSTERLDNSTLNRFREEDVVDVILEVVFGPSMLCIFVLLCLVSWIIRLSKSQERLMPSSMSETSESVDDCPPSYEEATQSTKVEIFVVDPPSYEEALRLV